MFGLADRQFGCAFLVEYMNLLFALLLFCSFLFCLHCKCAHTYCAPLNGKRSFSKRETERWRDENGEWTKSKERTKRSKEEKQHWCRTINSTNLISSYKACGHINGVKKRVHTNNTMGDVASIYTEPKLSFYSFVRSFVCTLLFIHSFIGHWVSADSVGVNALARLEPPQNCNDVDVWCDNLAKNTYITKICSIEPFSPAALFICCRIYLSACPRFT